MRAIVLRAAAAIGFVAIVIAIVLAVNAYHSLDDGGEQADLSALSDIEIETLIKRGIQNADYLTVRDLGEQIFNKATIDDQAELTHLAATFSITSPRIRGSYASSAYYEVCIVGSETTCFGLSATIMYLNKEQWHDDAVAFPYSIEVNSAFAEEIQRLATKHSR